MKAIKLFIMFVLILAIIVGGMFVGKFIKIPNNPPQPVDKSQKKLCDEIESSWQKVSDWDEALYDSLWHKCRAYDPQNKKVTDDLITFNTGEAIGFISKKIFHEWSRPNCKEDTIKRYIEAINHIVSKDSSANDQLKVNTIKDVNKTYNNALRFARKEISYSPYYNGNSNTWKDFDKYKEGIEKERDNIQGNANYKQYLSNISVINDKLKGVDGELETAKSSFCKELKREIKAYFNGISNPTDGDCTRLKTAKDKYQETLDKKDTELNDFLTYLRGKCNDSKTNNY